MTQRTEDEYQALTQELKFLQNQVANLKNEVHIQLMCAAIQRCPLNNPADVVEWSYRLATMGAQKICTPHSKT